jgi:hypothetical protein
MEFYEDQKSHLPAQPTQQDSLASKRQDILQALKSSGRNLKGNMS